ncbi:MAG: preprotein translocase subunit SecE [Halobacteriovoraceae bacterium]|nr:preprotein translocase subunit SecE [Halobacteriovoraceae bacterium]
MSGLDAKDSKKVINAFVAIVSMISAYVFVRFFSQLGEWFDLEAKISNFNGVSQGIGGAIGLIAFLAVTKNSKASKYMAEVYSELTKVVWPNKDEIVKVTVGIVIGVTITSLFFVLIDWLTREFLTLLY